MSVQDDTDRDCRTAIETDNPNVTALLYATCNERAWVESSVVLDLADYC